ncbi:hypothetical protein BP6252_06577 [Coleophoma cylindrospora]|uniref:N-acetyltransferase domain-containing protein n=1 Tax=Coleophoma cylindrospora TaxID=1849047 RepID=A0A3D8RN05_9HELO|nr:hypothetical protein BP6252_06577 [Coleophoma cylindrospora]
MSPTSKPLVTLIPWDPESPEHRERMYQQRVACGWNQEAVGGWTEAQLKGKMALHWVTLTDANEDKEAKLAAHTSKYPAELVPITDTALQLQGKPRTPTHVSFIPVGHISLDSELEYSTDPRLVDVSNGVYHISSFYVSRALQSGGLGRATMDCLEDMATAEPLCAKVLTLRTMAKASSLDENRLKALGKPSAPKERLADIVQGCEPGLVYEARL